MQKIATSRYQHMDMMVQMCKTLEGKTKIKNVALYAVKLAIELGTGAHK